MRVGCVAVVEVAGKGRGVVTVGPVEQGALLCTAAAAELSSEECDRLEQTSLGDYYFAHPVDGERGCLLFGEISLVNHADEPNCEVRWRFEPGAGWVAELFALADLPAGCELSHRYRCPPWFPVVR